MRNPIPWLRRRGTKTDAFQLYREFQQSLTLIQNLEQVIGNLVGKAGEILGTEKVYLTLLDEESHQYRLAHALEEGESVFGSLPREDPLVRWLEVNQSALSHLSRSGVWETLPQPTRSMLERLSVQVVLPISGLNRTLGILFASPPQGREECDPEALETLVSLAPQMGLALENSLLYRERRERLRHMTRADRLATVGVLAAGAAHEIRNPLTAIKSTLQFVLPKQTNETARRMLGQALEETERIERILSGLLSFARQGEMKREAVALEHVLEQTLDLVAFQARQQKIQILLPSCREPVWVEGDPAQLTQLFLNLFLNAIQAMPQGGTLSVDLSRQVSHLSVCVADTGTGIPASHLDQIFDPFFTTKKEGTGLGLSICFGIAQRHGGDIRVESTLGHGTRMLVRLPLARSTPEASNV